MLSSPQSIYGGIFSVTRSSGCQDISVWIKKVERPSGSLITTTPPSPRSTCVNFFHWFNSCYRQDAACEHVIPLQPFLIFLHLAFITPADSMLMKCKLQTWPHPALLTSTTAIFLHLFSSSFLLLPSASLTLRKHLNRCQSSISASAGEPAWFFITQIKNVRGLWRSRRRLILINTQASICSHVWSHISHLSLLGSYNLPQAFSRNPADSVIWNALWLFIMEFTHVWEAL